MQELNLQKNDQLLKWVESLALEELNTEESGIVHLNSHLDPNHYLEESSIEFMNLLRGKFEVLTARFNEYRGNAHDGNQVKIFKISNTVNDFMLFRNALRLVFSRKSNDVIHIQFIANGKDVFAARLNQTEQYGSKSDAHEIRANVGPFNDISWNFAGEKVQTESLVRHYLTEFIRNSAR